MRKECNKRLNVLHVASGDLWAGAEMQLYTLANAQNNHLGMDVSVVLMNNGILERRLNQSGIKVTVIDESQFNIFRITQKLARLIRDSKPDIVHTHRRKENISGSIAAYIAGNIPSLRTIHGSTEHQPKWYQAPQIIICITDLLCGRYIQKAIIAISYELGNKLRQSFSENIISVIENGIDTTSLNLKKEPNTHQNNSRHLKIGYAGRLVPVKRIDIIIKTAHLLHRNKQEFEFSFHIFGDGPLLDVLVSLNRELGTEDMVHFEGHTDNIHENIANMDMMILTSDHEGLPMILLETMLLNIPIISHAVGGIPKLLNEGECGILVSDNDSYTYATEILNLARNRDTRMILAKNANNRVKECYSANNNARQYCKVYNSIIEDSH